MAYAHPEALVSTADLAARLGAPDLRVLDASWHLPQAGRDPRVEFAQQHAPGAAFFDLDAISDRRSELPHMLPSETEFAAAMSALGIGDEHRVVVYDVTGMMSAARAWWMLRAFGHDQVAILDGGLAKWLAEGRPVEAGAVTPAPATFTPRFKPELVRSKEQVRLNIPSRREQVLDARAAGRFKGTEPEVWPGRRAGHIPGSLNLPYVSLIDPKEKTVLPEEVLRARFEEAGIDLRKPVVASCGSGVTACVLAFGLHLLGSEDVAVYDGSWAEWGLPGDTPVETG